MIKILQFQHLKMFGWFGAFVMIAGKFSFPDYSLDG